MSMSLKARFMSKIDIWINNTTLHGFSKVANASNIFQTIANAFVLLSVLGFASFLIVDLFTEFLAYNVNTKLIRVDNNRIDFPAVTICNLNRYNTEKNQFPAELKSEMIKFLEKENLSNMLNEGGIFSMSVFYKTTKRIMTKMIQNSSFHERISLGFEMNEMLISCLYNQEECNSDEFSPLSNNPYTLCHTFNKNKTKKIYRGGIQNGLTLELYIGNGTKADLAKSMGVRVYVHEPLQDVADLTLTEEGFFLAPGTDTLVEISQTKFKLLNKPYGNCIEDITSIKELDSQIEKYVFQEDGSYSQKKCFHVAQGDYLDKQCLNISKLNETVCRVINTSKFYADKKVYLNAKNICRKECNSIEYSLSTSFAKYPTEFYQLFSQTFIEHFAKKYPNASQNDFDLGDMGKNTLSVTLFYKDSTYNEIEQTPAILLINLISNFGGLLGLCVGASLISILEVVELLLGLFLVLLKFLLVGKPK